MGQPASCEVRWGGSMPPQVKRILFEFWLVSRPEKSPGRMCGDRADLVLRAPTKSRFGRAKGLLLQTSGFGPAWEQCRYGPGPILSLSDKL